MSDDTFVLNAGVREERKIVTALFADLVGSTALAERLDAEDIKLVVGEAIARIVIEVERLGGHVKDLAGDGMLAFFGAPLASEDDPERAIRAGLAITAALADYAQEVERAWTVHGFGVRVGLATGPVVLGTIGAGSRVEFAAYGDTVNTAARLQAGARPGSVLVDEATQRLVAPLFEWSDPIDLEAKGKAEPVRSYVARRAYPGAGKPRGLAGVTTPIVGRDTELSQADEALHRLRAGTGGVLFVAGEAGIGKSRLLAELRARAQTTRNGSVPLWLEGRCVSYGESLPWWPFRDLLREWLGIGLDDPELRTRIALRRRVEELFPGREVEHYPYLAAMLGLSLEPDVASRVALLSPEALQYRTFEVIGSLFERLAANRPVAVAIEDLHWADATSVQLFERLLPVTERAALLLTASLRDERDHASWAVRELAQREYPHLAVALSLAPLTQDADAALLRELVGEETLPQELESRVLEAAEGNPFCLEELVRALADSGALVRENGRWRFDHDVGVEVPPTVEKVILARLDRLPAATRDVLVAASVLGRRFGLALLESVVGDSLPVADALHDLQRLDFVRAARRWPQPEYRFKHALIQETAYRTLLSEQRSRLHRRAAEWLERRQDEGGADALGLLAHHWLAAEDEEKALEYLTRAGDRARLEWALDEAIEHYQALLPLLERRGEQQAMALVLFKLALALHTALRFRESNDAYQRAFDLWEPPSGGTPTATLRIGVNVVASQPDPPRSYMPPDIQLQMALFDRLVERWPEATIVPSLAERWDIAEDGLRYVFRLREGVSWSDGTPLTAHDVVYGVKRNLDRERPGVSVAMLFALENAQDYFRGRSDDLDAVGVRALDDRTIEFRLVAPAPYFFSMVNRPDAGPQPKHAIERHGDEWARPGKLVGSGAFMLAEASGERVVLERRSESQRRRGNVRRVELVGASVTELRESYGHGTIEMAAPRVTYDSEELVAVAAEDVSLEPAAYLFFLVIDHSHPDLARLDVRRALAHAIDRVELQASLPHRLVAAAGGVVPPALQGHTPEIVPGYDPDLARQLLGRAPPTSVISLAIPEGLVIEEAVSAVGEMWERELGIEIVRVKSESTAAIFFSGWFPGYPDPEYYLRLLLHSEAQDNDGGFRHAPFDELIERARTETDGHRRLELFHAADRMAVAEQVAVIPLAYGRNIFVVKPWVKGWWEYGKSWSSFADLVVGEPSD